MTVINCFDISKISKSSYDIFYFSCSKERREKADKFRFFEDSIRCILSETLLQYSIYQLLGHVPNIVIYYNQFGKPYVSNLYNFFYNISHSGKWVVLAYSDAEVGIDIEKIHFSYDEIPKNFFTTQEAQFIISASNKTKQAERFTQIWTLKESYTKYYGTGLFTDLKTFSVINSNNEFCDHINPNHIYPQLSSRLFDDTYYLSLCYNKDISKINIISLDQLLQFNQIQKNNH